MLSRQNLDLIHGRIYLGINRLSGTARCSCWRSKQCYLSFVFDCDVGCESASRIPLTNGIKEYPATVATAVCELCIIRVTPTGWTTSRKHWHRQEGKNKADQNWRWSGFHRHLILRFGIRPNDPKLSDGGAKKEATDVEQRWLGRDGFELEIAATVTRGAVPCSAWLGVAVLLKKRLIEFLWIAGHELNRAENCELFRDSGGTQIQRSDVGDNTLQKFVDEHERMTTD